MTSQRRVFLLQINPTDKPSAAEQIRQLNDNFLAHNDLVQIEPLTPEGKEGFCYVLFIGTPSGS
jgi:hypothetical protein